MILTPRILLGPRYKPLRDCANKFTEIELVLRSTARFPWDCAFQGHNYLKRFKSEPFLDCRVQGCQLRACHGGDEGGRFNKGGNSSNQSAAPPQTSTGVQTMSTPFNHDYAGLLGLLEDADEDNAQTIK